MNRSARRAFAAIQRRPAPAYGRPADLLRQLAALGATVKLVRLTGHFRLDYGVRNDRMNELRAVQSAFPSTLEWDTEVIATLVVLAGRPIDSIPRNSEREIDLVDLLANPPRDALARRLLASGVRQ